jgi:type VI secretion system secreted protein Hcp
VIPRLALAAGIGILVVAATPAFSQQPTRMGQLVNPPATAPADKILLELKGIEGESQSADHKDWINLLSVSNNITRLVDSGAGNTAGPGEFTATRHYGKASPQLMQFCATGGHFDEGSLDIVSSDGATTMQIRLSNVVISSYSVSGSGDAGLPAMEQIGFVYQKIRW